MRITQPVSNIYKLEVPFDDIYTSVFVLKFGERYAIVDAATTDFDVDRYIVPALAELGLSARAPEALLLTHRHGDHAGGAKRLSEIFPGMPVYSSEGCRDVPTRTLCDGDVLFDLIEVVMLPGHTDTSVGFLDRRTDTLLSGDCLQQRGVSRYTNGVKDREAYLRSIARLRTMRLSRILASHEYVPLGSTAEGEAAVRAYLDECERDA